MKRALFVLLTPFLLFSGCDKKEKSEWDVDPQMVILYLQSLPRPNPGCINSAGGEAMTDGELRRITITDRSGRYYLFEPAEVGSKISIEVLSQGCRLDHGFYSCDDANVSDSLDYNDPNINCSVQHNLLLSEYGRQECRVVSERYPRLMLRLRPLETNCVYQVQFTR